MSIVIDIPGFRRLEIRMLFCDFTGTLSCGGRLAPGVVERLRLLAGCVEVRIVTSDTYGTAETELAGLPCLVHRLSGAAQDEQKRDYAQAAADLRHAAAAGNGRNDVPLLRAVRTAGGLAIAVDNGEGCAAEAAASAEIFISGAANALDLLLDVKRAIATLRA